MHASLVPPSSSRIILTLTPASGPATGGLSSEGVELYSACCLAKHAPDENAGSLAWRHLSIAVAPERLMMTSFINSKVQAICRGSASINKRYPG